MKRSVTLATLAVLLTGLLLLGFADSSIPEDEASSTVSKARNASASATIVNAWTTAPDEGD